MTRELAIAATVATIATVLALAFSHGSTRDRDHAAERARIAEAIADCDRDVADLARTYASIAPPLPARSAHDMVDRLLAQRVRVCTEARTLLDRELARTVDADLQVARARIDGHLDRLRRARDAFESLDRASADEYERFERALQRALQ